jgi:hypothetical protein
MDLIYGLLIGTQFMLILGLAGAGYYLFTRVRKGDGETKAQGKAIADLSERLQEVDSALTTETDARIRQATDLDNRLKHFENYKVPEHLSLTDELTIQGEVAKRLANYRETGDINYLDEVRESELAVHNAQHHPRAVN